MKKKSWETKKFERLNILISRACCYHFIHRI